MIAAPVGESEYIYRKALFLCSVQCRCNVCSTAQLCFQHACVHTTRLFSERAHTKEKKNSFKGVYEVTAISKLYWAQ